MKVLQSLVKTVAVIFAGIFTFLISLTILFAGMSLELKPTRKNKPPEGNVVPVYTVGTPSTGTVKNLITNLLTKLINNGRVLASFHVPISVSPTLKDKEHPISECSVCKNNSLKKLSCEVNIGEIK